MERKIELGNMRVADVRRLLVKSPCIIEENSSMEILFHKMIENPQTRHVYVVNKDGVLVGSVRMNTVVKYLFPITTVIEEGIDLFYKGFFSLRAATVKSIMNTYPVFVKEETMLSDMAKILVKEQINELPVVDEEKRIIGQINVYEVIQAYLESF